MTKILLRAKKQPFSVDDELERLEHSVKFQALLDKSRRQIEETGGIPHEQFWREVTAQSRTAGTKSKPVSRKICRPDRAVQS